MELCCKCPKPARSGGRYCNDCHAERQREYDRAKAEAKRQGHGKPLQELLAGQKRPAKA